MDAAQVLLLARTLRRIGRRTLLDGRAPVMEENEALLIGVLLQGSTLSQAALAGCAGMDQGQASRLVRSMAEREWLEVSPSGDGRANWVRIGQLPETVATRAQLGVGEAVKRICPRTRQLDYSEFARLHDVMEELARELRPGRWW